MALEGGAPRDANWSDTTGHTSTVLAHILPTLLLWWTEHLMRWFYELIIFIKINLSLLIWLNLIIKIGRYVPSVILCRWSVHLVVRLVTSHLSFCFRSDLTPQCRSIFWPTLVPAWGSSSSSWPSSSFCVFPTSTAISIASTSTLFSCSSQPSSPSWSGSTQTLW